MAIHESRKNGVDDLAAIADVCRHSGEEKSMVSGIFTLMAMMGEAAVRAFREQGREMTELRREVQDLRQRAAPPQRSLHL